ncbi:hypothetical protein [Streptomyces sp. NPDC095613]|uniref:hypothetical protein n=1 Tax=Streptomyces sp. NPDC095613 TaxID=3155540 RepID=UPI003325CF86
MNRVCPPVPHHSSAACLTRRVLLSLRGAGGTAVVAEHVERARDPDAALAAIRILGADVVAPALLTNAAFHARDAEAVIRAFTVLPLPRTAPPAPPTGPEEPWLSAWHDWGTLTSLAVVAATASASLRVPRPAGPLAAAPAAASGTGWAVWSVMMSRLAPLALPGLDGPVHDAARASALELARGATRAVLRRDAATAARVIRWLAWLRADGVPLPLELGPLLGHVALMRGGDRPALDIAIARRLLIAPVASAPRRRAGSVPARLIPRLSWGRTP